MLLAVHHRVFVHLGSLDSTQEAARIVRGAARRGEINSSFFPAPSFQRVPCIDGAVKKLELSSMMHTQAEARILVCFLRFSIETSVGCFQFELKILYMLVL